MRRKDSARKDLVIGTFTQRERDANMIDRSTQRHIAQTRRQTHANVRGFGVDIAHIPMTKKNPL